MKVFLKRFFVINNIYFFDFFEVKFVSVSICFPQKILACTNLALLHRAVVRGGAGGFSIPGIWGFQKRTEWEIDSLLLSAPPGLKT